MGTRTGTASVDILADVSEFGSRFERDLNDALKKTNVNAKPVADKLHKQVGAAGVKIGEELGEGISRGADGKLRDAQGNFIKSGEQAGQGFSKGISKGMEKTGEFSRQLAIMAARLTLVASAAASAAPGLLHLTAAILPAAGALLVLPAAMLAVKAASATLSIATAGVGDAITKGLTGTADQAKKALEGLPPAARTFAKSIIDLKPQIDALRNSVSGRFFKPLQDEVAATAGIYLPLLTREMSNLAGPLGGLGEQFAQSARKASVFGSVSTLFQATGMSVINLRAAVDPLVTAMAALIEATAPKLPVIAQGFANIATRAGEWITAASQSGRISELYEAGVATLKDLGGILANVGSIVTSVFQAATAGGSSLLANVRDLTGQVAAFFNSAQGGEVLAAVFSTLGQIGAALRTSLGAALPAIGQALQALLPVVAGLAPSFANLVVAVAPVVPMLAQAAAVIVGAFVPAIASLTGFLAQHSGVVKAVVIALGAYVAASKAAAAVAAVQAAGGLVAWAKATTVVTTVTKIATAAQIAFGAALKFALGPVGLIITAIAALVAGLVWLYNSNETFRNFVNAAWAGIKNVIGAVVNWLVGTAWPLIKQAWDAIAAAAIWLWQTILAPAFQAIGAVAMWLWNNAIKPAFDGIAAATRAYASVVTWLWTTIIQPYFQFIGNIAMWLWNNIITPAWQGIVILTQALGATFAWLYSVFAPPIQAVASLVFWLWQSVFLVAWEGIKLAFQALAAVATWWWQNVLSPVFSAVGAAARWLWTNAIVPAFNGMKAAFMIAANAARQVWNNYISPAWKAIQAATQTLWSSYISPIFNAIRSHIVSQIQRAVAVISAIRGFVSNVSANFTSMVNAIKSRLNSAVAAVRGLPGRIKSAVGNLGSLLYSAGANAIQGLINGISNKLGALRAKAAAAASVIRNLFPFSPAKEGPLSGSGSPEIAGGKIATMIAAGMERSTPKLVDAARAMAAATMGGRGGGLDFAGQGILRAALGANGSGAVTGGASGGGGITFADGAIRITFSGAVPTQDEAYRTGQAVGAGIASTLTSRNVHNTVRTI
jgi:phage-related protein